MKKVLVLLGIMVLFCAVRSEASMIEIGQNPLVISTQKGNDKPPVYSVPVLIEPGNVRVKSVGKLIEAILRSQNKLTQLREFKNLLNNLNLDNYNAEAGFNLVYEVTEGKKEVQILGGKLSVELILTPKNKIDIKVIRVGLNFDLNSEAVKALLGVLNEDEINVKKNPPPIQEALLRALTVQVGQRNAIFTGLAKPTGAGPKEDAAEAVN